MSGLPKEEGEWKEVLRGGTKAAALSCLCCEMSTTDALSLLLFALCSAPIVALVQICFRFRGPHPNKFLLFPPQLWHFLSEAGHSIRLSLALSAHYGQSYTSLHSVISETPLGMMQHLQGDDQRLCWLSVGLINELAGQQNARLLLQKNAAKKLKPVYSLNVLKDQSSKSATW